jgi:hypothetical protein
MPHLKFAKTRPWERIVIIIAATTLVITAVISIIISIGDHCDCSNYIIHSVTVIVMPEVECCNSTAVADY